jgi:penicillin-binding protein 2
MTSELDQLRRLRPDVPPPSPEARERVLSVLRRTIEDAGTPVVSAPPARRPQWRLPSLGVAMAMIASVGALVIAGGALVLLHHHAHRTPSAAVGAAPARGEILAADGSVLVGTQSGYDVQIVPSQLPVTVSTVNVLTPPHADTVIYRRLAAELRISTRITQCLIDNPTHPSRTITVRLAEIPCEVIQQLQTAPDDDVTVAANVRPAVRTDLEQNALSGVSLTPIHRPSYPHGDLAAQVLGTLGPITPGVLRASNVTAKTIAHSRFKGLPLNAQVGQSGLEYEYDAELRAGDALKTTLDAKLQQVGEQALQTSISDNSPADGGAFVAMDPENGDVYAMGSNPTYQPSLFTKPISTATYEKDFGANANDPQLNRAIQSAGATGSTFKVITATAALESGIWTPGETYDDTGSFNLDGETLHNSGHAAYGIVNIVQAIEVSDDIFFYNLGARLNSTAPNGGALQAWARKYGIGRKTGIDLPGEVAGTLPSPRQIAKQYYQEEVPCENATGIYKGRPKHPASQGGCGIASNPDWTIGDNVNTAVGQGDDQVTPLQLAVTYGALANGGTVVTPHVGMDIQSSNGDVITRIAPGPQRHLNINPTDLATIRQGLREAASAPGLGTSADVMGDFPEQVYGKTGTAEYINNGVEQDYAWYACFVPASATSKPIVVVVTVEKGGFGDVAAAPVARQILSQWFLDKPGPFKDGTSTTL